jgi:hypothetical protein
LRHFVREVARREEIRQIVKGADATKPSDEYDFGMLVDDVDMVRLCVRVFLCAVYLNCLPSFLRLKLTD